MNEYLIINPRQGQDDDYIGHIEQKIKEREQTRQALEKKLLPKDIKKQKPFIEKKTKDTLPQDWELVGSGVLSVMPKINSDAPFDYEADLAKTDPLTIVSTEMRHPGSSVDNPDQTVSA